MQELVAQIVAKHVEATGQSAIIDISEIDHVGHHLLEVAGVGSVAEVAVLLGNEVVSLVRELVLDDVLETVLVERPGAVDLLEEPGLELEEGLDEVPVLEVKLEGVIVPAGVLFQLSDHVVLTVIWRFWVLCIQGIPHRLIVVSPENEIGRVADHLIGVHPNDITINTIGCNKLLIIFLEVFPLVLSVAIVSEVSMQNIVLHRVS